MIDPLRYRSMRDQLEFDESDAPFQCWQCLQERVSTPAFCLCHECGNIGTARPFCETCFLDFHTTRKKGKEGHKPHPIVRGDPVVVQTLADGDGATFPKMHDWVTLDYILTTGESDEVIEDTLSTKQPLIFQSGCSGPCIHLQFLGCTDIAAADILGFSDPYCAVYWNNNLAGATTTKHMTLNPVWANQTFVLPLAADFMAALDHEDGSSALFNAGALLPKLRIELYDWDRLSKNDFLGQASISDADIIRVMRQTRSGELDANHVIPFNLMPKQSRGNLGIRVALRGEKLFVHVMQAENVPKADPYSLSDPYCEVYWNDKKIGKTARVDNTLDPVWDLEIFVIKMKGNGPNSIDQSTLRIVCLDWDQFGSDDVLGQIELKGWQIKELAECGVGEGITSSEDNVLGEAEMERIYEFIHAFQKYEMEEGMTGKMVVGVPQDPAIQTNYIGKSAVGTAEDVQVAPEPNKKNGTRNKKRKQGADAKGKVGQEEIVDLADGNMIKKNQLREGTEAVGANPGGADGLRQVHENDEGEMVIDITVQEEAVVVEARTIEGEECRVEDGESLGQIDGGKDAKAADADISSVDQDHLDVCATPRGSENREDGLEIVPDSQGTVPSEDTQATPDNLAGCLVKSEAENTTGELLQPATPHRSAQKVLFAPENEGDKILDPVPPADTEDEGDQIKNDSSKRDNGVRGNGPIVVRYRDASVQRFEEDRGVLVQYIDDSNAVWIATRFIPRLQIRNETPVVQNLFRRLWNQRGKLFNAEKSVLNIKRGLKVVLAMALTGSQMQWYKLELTGEQSGANFVRGTANLRFLYHTRGSVLRGLDVAVSHMSLGERARVDIRADYGFGEVYAARKVPPYATLIFVAQVAAIGKKNAKGLLNRRAVRDAVGDALFRARLYVSTRLSLSGSWGRFNLLRLFGKGKSKVEEQSGVAEEKRLDVVEEELSESSRGK